MVGYAAAGYAYNESGLIGLALDIRYGSTWGYKGRVPSTFEEASEVLDTVVEHLGGARPTVVFDHGRALQAIWLFDKPTPHAQLGQIQELATALDRLVAHVSYQLGYDI